MKIFKHLTANNIHLTRMPFQRELAMEAYLIENESVLVLDGQTFENVEIIEAELSLKEGRGTKNTDGRIDLLVTYSEEYIGVVELKLGQLNQNHLQQLEDYLNQKDQIITRYSDKLGPEIIKAPKWIGVLVGLSIESELEKKIVQGYMTKQNIPIAALTIQRFRGDDGQIYVVTDTYFNLTNAKDTNQYTFEGEKYGKARLVLAVISDFVQNNSNITYAELAQKFHKKLQGSVGVFATREEAEEIYSKTSRKRHFLKPEEIIKLADSEIAVSTQWGASNIQNFLEAAKLLGYKIT